MSDPTCTKTPFDRDVIASPEGAKQSTPIVIPAKAGIQLDPRLRGGDKKRSDDTDGIGKLSTPLHPTENLAGILFHSAIAEASGNAGDS